MACIKSAIGTNERVVRLYNPPLKSARAAIGKVAEGLDTSTKYLTDRGIGGVVEDGEALIRRYPFQAFLIGCSVGFLLSRSRPR